MTIRRMILGLLALTLPSAAVAQATGRLPSICTPDGAHCSQATGVVIMGTDGSILTPLSKQESFQLVAANTASAAATLYGGDYVLSQTCTAYGTLAFQVLGPDGVSYLTLGSYTATDTGSAHGFSLGSNARVRVTITGTTGCNAILARVPS